MNVFLCHAAEDHAAAERIQLALAGAKFHVFFDEQSLPASSDYHARIRDAVAQSDLFIFLITTNSVAEGNFCLTEVQFAREKWPHPAGRVVPVNLDKLPIERIPNYLQATTILTIRGNAPAEVRAVAETLRAALRRNPFAQASLLGRPLLALTLVGTIAFYGWHQFLKPKDEPIEPPTELAQSANAVGVEAWIYVGTRIHGKWQKSQADGIEPPLTLDVSDLPIRGAAYRVIREVNLRQAAPTQRSDRSRPPMASSKGTIGAGSVVKVDDLSQVEVNDQEPRIWVWAHVTVLEAK